jgi:hypothetical protein
VYHTLPAAAARPTGLTPTHPAVSVSQFVSQFVLIPNNHLVARAAAVSNHLVLPALLLCAQASASHTAQNGFIPG